MAAVHTKHTHTHKKTRAMHTHTHARRTQHNTSSFSSLTIKTGMISVWGKKLSVWLLNGGFNMRGGGRGEETRGRRT